MLSVSSAPPARPHLVPPPREVPLGVRLRILDSHHTVSGTLWFTLPAAVALLLAAIGQPVRAARTVLVVFAAVMLLVAVWTSLPQLRRAMRRAHRMATGTVAMGRIVSCRIAGQRERDAKPNAEFLRDHGELLAARMASMVLGFLLNFLVLPVAAVFGLVTLGIVITAIARLFDPSIDAGDVDFDYFVRLCLAFIALAVIALVVRARWREASVPLMDAYLRFEWQRGMANEDERIRQRIRKALDEAAKAGLKFPLPERSDAGVPLTCEVEYLAMGAPQAATASSVLGNHLSLAGIEPLLFDPANPGEVELFAGLSTLITWKNGQWQPIPWLGSATSLAFAGTVFTMDALLLLEEIVALVH